MAAREIRGCVTDAATGETLIGASITVKGSTQQGVVTGLDGCYSINTAEAAPVLVC